jgi:hypothetical protein
MLPKDTHAPLRIGDYALNSLTFQQQQVSIILGHSLRSLYEDMLNAPIPDNLQTLTAQLEPKMRLESQLQDEPLSRRQP